jgi:hypothetical protein
MRQTSVQQPATLTEVVFQADKETSNQPTESLCSIVFIALVTKFDSAHFTYANTDINWLDFIAGSHSCKPEKVNFIPANQES